MGRDYIVSPCKSMTFLPDMERIEGMSPEGLFRVFMVAGTIAELMLGAMVWVWTHDFSAVVYYVVSLLFINFGCFAYVEKQYVLQPRNARRGEGCS